MEENVQFFFDVFLCKIHPPIIALPPFPKSWFNQIESTLPENASTEVTAFLAVLLLRRRFLRFFSIHPYVKSRNPSPTVAKTFPWES